MFSATNFDDFKNRFMMNPGGLVTSNSMTSNLSQNGEIDEENKEEVKYLTLPKSQSSKATYAKSAQEAAA